MENSQKFRRVFITLNENRHLLFCFKSFSFILLSPGLVAMAASAKLPVSPPAPSAGYNYDRPQGNGLVLEQQSSLFTSSDDFSVAPQSAGAGRPSTIAFDKLPASLPATNTGYNYDPPHGNRITLQPQSSSFTSSDDFAASPQSHLDESHAVRNGRPRPTNIVSKLSVSPPATGDNGQTHGHGFISVQHSSTFESSGDVPSVPQSSVAQNFAVSNRRPMQSTGSDIENLILGTGSNEELIEDTVSSYQHDPASSEPIKSIHLTNSGVIDTGFSGDGEYSNVFGDEPLGSSDTEIIPENVIVDIASKPSIQFGVDAVIIDQPLTSNIKNDNAVGVGTNFLSQLLGSFETAFEGNEVPTQSDAETPFGEETRPESQGDEPIDFSVSSGSDTSIIISHEAIGIDSINLETESSHQGGSAGIEEPVEELQEITSSLETLSEIHLIDDKISNGDGILQSIVERPSHSTTINENGLNDGIAFDQLNGLVSAESAKNQLDFLTPEEELAMLASSLPGGGTPGEDYPILSQIPETDFSCKDQTISGYYADTTEESRCQVFHICQIRENGRTQQDSFLCPIGTLFNQAHMVCEWWFNVDCSLAKDFYIKNEKLGEIPIQSESAGNIVDVILKSDIPHFGAHEASTIDISDILADDLQQDTFISKEDQKAQHISTDSEFNQLETISDTLKSVEDEIISSSEIFTGISNLPFIQLNEVVDAVATVDDNHEHQIIDDTVPTINGPGQVESISFTHEESFTQAGSEPLSGSKLPTDVPASRPIKENARRPPPNRSHPSVGSEGHHFQVDEAIPIRAFDSVQTGLTDISHNHDLESIHSVSNDVITSVPMQTTHTISTHTSDSRPTHGISDVHSIHVSDNLISQHGVNQLADVHVIQPNLIGPSNLHVIGSPVPSDIGIIGHTLPDSNKRPGRINQIASRRPPTINVHPVQDVAELSSDISSPIPRHPTQTYNLPALVGARPLDTLDSSLNKDHEKLQIDVGGPQLVERPVKPQLFGRPIKPIKRPQSNNHVLNTQSSSDSEQSFSQSGSVIPHVGDLIQNVHAEMNSNDEVQSGNVFNEEHAAVSSVHGVAETEVGQPPVVGSAPSTLYGVPIRK